MQGDNGLENVYNSMEACRADINRVLVYICVVKTSDSVRFYLYKVARLSGSACIRSKSMDMTLKKQIFILKNMFGTDAWRYDDTADRTFGCIHLPIS